MNTEIHNAFINAILADACYVDGLMGVDLSTKLGPRLTQTLATYVGDNFNVVTQWTDPGSSGFSVTVFEDKATSQRYVSLRGTEPGSLSDYITDADAYIGSGLARRQVIAMVNWYLRATTPTSMDAVQIHENRSVDLVTGELGPATYTTRGEGTLLGAGMLVTDGHSLGGHLTTVFTRLFASDVSNSYTYNGLGVGWRYPESILREIEDALGLGATAWPSGSKQNNYYAEHGINSATNDWWLSQKGQRIPLFNEEGTGLPNHSMYKLTDSMALADVLGMMDSSLSLSTVTALFDAASNTPANSLETILDALRKAVSNNTTPTAVGDAENSAATRVDFHTKLSELRNVILAAGDNRYPIASLVGKSADGLIGLARHGDIDALAYRYALKELSPFAILGLDYSRFNANGELNLFNPVTGQGGLTDEYLTDRAAFLAWKNKLAVMDYPSAELTPYVGTGAVSQFFDDRASGLRIYMGTQPIADKRWFVFGTEGDDQGSAAIVGGNKNDNLYGGAGNDELKGEGGKDYLEGNAGDDRLYGGDQDDTLVGGAGDDRLEGGTGFDTYVVGQGTDTIVDEDGKGVVKDGQGRIIAGTFIRGADGRYTWAGNAAVGATRNSPLTITLENGAQVVIDNYDDFAEGELGIRLQERPEMPEIIDIVQGDRNGLGEYEPIEDVFRISGSSTGNYRIEAGQLSDFVVGGIGNDVIVGGADPDVLMAGNGNDLLFGGDQVDAMAYLEASRTAAGSGQRGDWLSGGRGRDTVVGTTANDVLFGGGGEDLLIGGAGDDVLDGDDNYIVNSTGYPNLIGLDIPEDYLAFRSYDWTITVGLSDGNPDPFNTIFSTVEQIEAAALVGAGDVMFGGSGNDRMHGLQGSDQLYGDSGDDVITGDDGADVIYGGDGNDLLTGERNGRLSPTAVQDPGGDFIDGEAGDDFIQGEDGDDYLVGGQGNDEIWGDARYSPAIIGNDSLHGGEGDDRLIGGGGDDTLFGGAGADTLYGDTDDTAAEGMGDDRLDGGEGDDYLNGHGGDDTLIGGAGNDGLGGGEGGDTIEGGEGNDFLMGEAGNDVLK